LLIFAAAGTIYEYSGISSNFNFVLAIDNSQAMSQEELDAIKEFTINFVDILPSGIKIGLISFSENTQIENPLTTNKNEITASIENLVLQDNEDRNILGSISESVKLLLAEEERVIRAKTGQLSPSDVLLTTAPRAIILITSQKETEFSAEEAITLANDNVATIHSIGMKLNQEDSSFSRPLTILAQSTGGEFYSIDNAILLRQAYSQISSITRGNVAYELTSPILIAIIILLIIGWVLEYLRFGTIP